MVESTLLEDIETKRISASSSSYRSFLDNKSPGAALASQDFYQLVDIENGRNYSEKLSECRSRAWFVRNKHSGRVRVASKQCRLRWCFHCSEARQQFITSAVKPWWNKAIAPKLLTLTIKHSQKPLQEQIDFLYKSFTKLRNRKDVKRKTRGGIWFFQITYNKRRREWHPHLHVLLDADFIPHNDIQYFWHQITRTSDIVHIRSVHDPEKTLAHNARYAARPSALVNLPKELYTVLFDAFNGRRICGSYGTAKEISLRPAKPDDCNDWEYLGGFRLIYKLANDDDVATSIMKAWVTDRPMPEKIDMRHVDNDPRYFETNHPPPTDENAQQFIKDWGADAWA